MVWRCAPGTAPAWALDMPYLRTLDSVRNPPPTNDAVEFLRERGVALDLALAATDPTFSDRIDTALMALFRDQGAADVFEMLHRRARGSILDAVRRVVGERCTALDPIELVQDTFINVYRYARSFRDEHPSSFRAWARTIAHHTVSRAATRRSARALQPLPDGSLEPADNREAPLRSIYEHEDVRALHQSWMLFLAHYAEGFDALSPRDRRALELVELQGLSYTEAAATLRVGRSNMKMILFRARTRIQAHMRRSMGASFAFAEQSERIAV